MNQNFYTLKGYDQLEKPTISPAMEDYLEMICRSAKEQNHVRIGVLAKKLHVMPSSASKMVNRLKKQGLVDFQPYGILQLTEAGQRIGNYLLRRHEILHAFFCYLNHSEDQLEQVEKIEHFINEETVENLKRLLKRLSQQ